MAPKRKPIDLAKLDGRTRAGKLAREFRAGLIQHLGGRPSAPQAALIEQATQVKLRLVMMDRSFAEGARQASENSQYRLMTNSLSRLLGRLGAAPATTP